MTSSRKKALLLAAFTVGYNVIEGIIAIVAASASDSAALLGFGLDSFIESLSGSIIIWRFWKVGPEADEGETGAVEQKATRLVAYTFFILGAYVLFDASKALVSGASPSQSLVGLVLGIASVIVMPILYIAKRRLGESIGSQSLVADSKETLACVWLSVAMLSGVGLHYFWQIKWADPVAALLIAVLIIREGYETFKESKEAS